MNIEWFLGIWRYLWILSDQKWRRPVQARRAKVYFVDSKGFWILFFVPLLEISRFWVCFLLKKLILCLSSRLFRSNMSTYMHDLFTTLTSRKETVKQRSGPQYAPQLRQYTTATHHCNTLLHHTTTTHDCLEAIRAATCTTTMSTHYCNTRLQHTTATHDYSAGKYYCYAPLQHTTATHYCTAAIRAASCTAAMWARYCNTILQHTIATYFCNTLLQHTTATYYCWAAIRAATCSSSSTCTCIINESYQSHMNESCHSHL